MKANDILEKAAGHMKDRATTYDNLEGERSMGKTVEMFNTLYGLSVTEEQGWAFMAILKMVRSSQGDYRADNYEDLTAYAALMGESATERFSPLAESITELAKMSKEAIEQAEIARVQQFRLWKGDYAKNEDETT